MTRERRPFGGAVLVGGRSARMGRDKALVEVDGVPMAALVAGALRAAGAVGVSVVGGPAEWANRLGLPGVADRYPGEGPLGGLLSALGAADQDVLAVMACDLPWLDSATISALLHAGRFDIDSPSTRPAVGPDVALARTDRLEPLCGVWRVATARPVLQAAFDRGERAIHRALSGLDVIEVTVRSGPLTNVNTPTDLTRGFTRGTSGASQ